MLLITFFFLPAYAVDLEGGVRDIQRHQQWRSMEFRNPQFGFFLAARASTEDKDKSANLNITIPLDNNQCKETIELVFKLTTPAKEDIDQDGLVEFQLDERPPKLLSSKVVMANGDYFVFMRINESFRPLNLSGHRSMLANARGWGVAEFSLLGFDEAWGKARNSCNAFVAP